MQGLVQTLALLAGIFNAFRRIRNGRDGTQVIAGKACRQGAYLNCQARTYLMSNELPGPVGVLASG